MDVRLHPDPEAASQALAADLLAFVADRPHAVLALPSGNTPKRLYEILAGSPAFRDVTVFALDEYLGLPAADPRSFAAFHATHVFGPLGIDPARAHCLDGIAADLAAECGRYEAAIQAAGGLDLALLGLGANGHIAFNEPAARLKAATHVATLAPPANAVAPQGITMGVGTILGARAVWLLATGAKKAPAATRMRAGLLDPTCPATLLQAHPAARAYLDAAAATPTI